MRKYRIESLLVSRLLLLAYEVFIEHGCGDLPDDFYEGLSDEERKGIVRSVVAEQFGEDEAELFDEEGGNWSVQDSQLMLYFSNKLNNFALGKVPGEIQDNPCDCCVRGCHEHEGPMICSGECLETEVQNG